MGICSHTVAAAEKNGDLLFLEWLVQCAANPNISAVAMVGLPRGRGWKERRPKHSIARNDPPPINNYTVRPGVQSNDGVTLCMNSGVMVNVTNELHVPSDRIVSPNAVSSCNTTDMISTAGQQQHFDSYEAPCRYSIWITM